MSINSFLPRLTLYETDFFYQRFDEATAKMYEPVYHGDVFSALSDSNIIFGDYLNAATFGFVNSYRDIQKAYIYGDGSYDNYEWVAETLVSLSGSASYEGHKLDWAADTVNIIGNARPLWRPQISSKLDVINGVTV